MREAGADRAQPVRLIFAEVFQDGARSKTVGAKTMENRLFIFADSGHLWIGVQRIGITRQAVNQRLRRRRRLFMDEVRRSVRPFTLGAWSAPTAETAETANENRGTRDPPAAHRFRRSFRHR